MLQASSVLHSELDEQKMKYQGLLKDFTRLEQRYDNLREMSLITEVCNCSLTSVGRETSARSNRHTSLSALQRSTEKATEGPTPHTV